MNDKFKTFTGLNTVLARSSLITKCTDLKAVHTFYYTELRKFVQLFFLYQ